MKRLLLSLLPLMVIYTGSGQDNDYTKGPALGINFFFNDFKTAQLIRSSSVGAVLRDKTGAKFKEMSAGFAINYLQGLSNYWDFSATLGGSFLDYPFEGRPPSGDQKLLLEADASLHAKLFPDKYWIVPFVSAGLGASQYDGYYGAFVPIGGGVQVNLFYDAFMFINTQYRIKVTDNTNYHFYGSIGIAGNIGAKRKSASRE